MVDPNLIADLEADSIFGSTYLDEKEDIPRTGSKWWCHDFKEGTVVPTQSAIRTHNLPLGHSYLKLWLVERSGYVGRKKDNKQLNGNSDTGIFAAAGAGECGFIRPGNMDRITPDPTVSRFMRGRSSGAS
jgi:hypothetical protein